MPEADLQLHLSLLCTGFLWECWQWKRRRYTKMLPGENGFYWYISPDGHSTCCLVLQALKQKGSECLSGVRHPWHGAQAIGCDSSDKAAFGSPSHSFLICLWLDRDLTFVVLAVHSTSDSEASKSSGGNYHDYNRRHHGNGTSLYLLKSNFCLNSLCRAQEKECCRMQSNSMRRPCVRSVEQRWGELLSSSQSHHSPVTVDKWWTQ